jgi:hypothetical protein
MYSSNQLALLLVAVQNLTRDRRNNTMGPAHYNEAVANAYMVAATRETPNMHPWHSPRGWFPAYAPLTRRNPTAGTYVYRKL